ALVLGARLPHVQRPEREAAVVAIADRLAAPDRKDLVAAAELAAGVAEERKQDDPTIDLRLVDLEIRREEHHLHAIEPEEVAAVGVDRDQVGARAAFHVPVVEI